MMCRSRATMLKVSAFVARFIVTFFLTGTIKFGAVLYESVSSSDGFDKATTGLLFIIPFAVSRLLGPVVNILMTYISPRTLASAGGFVFGAGYVCAGLCELRPGYMFLFFTLSGLGMGCMLLPTVSNLKDAFGDGIRLAMPLSMLGGCAAFLVFPLATVYAHQEYGTGATISLFGAVSLNLVPCGFLLRNRRLPDPEGEDAKQGTEMAPHGRTRGSKYENSIDANEKQSRDSSGETTPILGLQRVFRGLRGLFNVNVCLFLVLANIRKIPNDSWTLYLIPRTEASWGSPVAAARVGSMGGFGGAVGRLVAAASFKTKSLTPVLLSSLYYVASGIIFVSMETFVYPSGLAWPAYAASFMNALFLSTLSGMVAGILHLLISEEYFLTAYAVIDLSNGIQSLLAGFTPGFLVDLYGDYVITFVVMGIVSFMCAVLCLLVWAIGSWKHHRAHTDTSCSP